MSSSDPRHGGDLDAASARFGTPADGWLDLSTGINPWPYSVPADVATTFARLPSPAALARLEATARQSYDAPHDAACVAGPGSEILIRLLTTAIAPPRVEIVAPTYGSHGDAWAATAAEVAPIDDIGAATCTPGSAVVVTSPNNPDGRRFAADDLAALARRLAAVGGRLIVDEAFADLDPDNSLVPLLHEAPALVLRSFGKFYGLPGVRLGFALGDAELAEALRARLGDWPVSAAAIAVGARALGDGAWQTETRARLREAAQRLRVLLADHGLPPAGGTDLFCLVAHEEAATVHVRLAKTGILTRHFADRGWLRFGLPADETDWMRLTSALARIGR